MTYILFTSALFLGVGYGIGKLFKNLNPFLMIFGFFLIAGISPALMEYDNDFYTLCLIVGGILNFKRPVTKVKNYVKDLIGTFSLRRMSLNYSDDINRQKQQAEEELHSQKRDVEEDLKRQKRQAEDDIQRQRREAEEAIKREAENLKREREQYQRDKNNKSSNSNNSNSDSRPLNPSIFTDACEILGLDTVKNKKEYKAAYLRLHNLYHPDKVAGLSGARRTQAENESKQINAAWTTIKKKLK